MPASSGPGAGGQPPGPEGTVYLLHLDPPLKHARHYTGWTSNLDQRLAAHAAGRGARLLEVVKDAGGTFRLVRTWVGSRSLEREIKNQQNAPRLCPECSPSPQPLNRARPGARPRNEAAAETSPEAEAETTAAGTVEEHLRHLRPRPAPPEAYDELMAVTDHLIAGWKARPAIDGSPPEAVPDAETELEIELLPRPTLPQLP